MHEAYNINSYNIIMECYIIAVVAVDDGKVSEVSDNVSYVYS